MTGRTVLITGATSGLGLEVAKILCEGGNDVVLAAREEEKAKTVMEKIKAKHPSSLVQFLKLDLAEKASIEAFVEEFRKLEKRLDVLVCTANVALGLNDKHKQYTKDNHELTVGTNYLGHFYLLHLLMDDLKKSGAETEDTRVVLVTSRLHDDHSLKKQFKLQAFDVEDMNYDKEGRYSSFQAYHDSKLALTCLTHILHGKLQEQEAKGISVNSVCPGYVPVGSFARTGSLTRKFYNKWLLKRMLRSLGASRDVHQGAANVTNMVTNESLKGVSGKYYQETAEVQSSEESRGEELQKRLWEVSGGLLHLDGFEPIEVKVPEVPAPAAATVEEKKEDSAAAGGDASAAAAEEEKSGEKSPGEEEKSGEATDGEAAAAAAATAAAGDAAAGAAEGKTEEKKKKKGRASGLKDSFLKRIRPKTPKKEAKPVEEKKEDEENAEKKEEQTEQKQEEKKENEEEVKNEDKTEKTEEEKEKADEKPAKVEDEPLKTENSLSETCQQQPAEVAAQ